MLSFFIILDWTSDFQLGALFKAKHLSFFAVVDSFFKGYEREMPGQIKLVEWNHRKPFLAEKNRHISRLSNVYMQITDLGHCACSLQCYRCQQQ